jgi:hypothetical protein
VIRRAVVLTLGLLLSASFAAAQTPPEAQTERDRIEILPRMVGLLSAEHLSGDDPRFVWDTQFGGELDVIDYGRGRATFRAVYQAMLGEELKHFDPNQGNYFLTGSVSVRARGVEMAGVLHHESRHLSDRTKRVAVDWNMLGGRVTTSFMRGRARWDARADLRGAVQKTFVDYTWELDTGVRGQYGIRPRVAAISDLNLRLLGTDGSQVRGTQTGARVEGGIRLEGRGGAVEIFLAGERRIDPYQLEFGTVNWFIAGFRFVSR